MAARSTAKPTVRPAPPQAPDARSRLRGRNVALALGLIAWVVLIFVITIVKMKGG
ncbi:hypothetical protein [Inquilinus limosus]|uniref:hypothetical protein n=1 Tax=Inquilinus limosus TaxID=171674 RepID=UPI0013A07D90|nr:hypothetical protein [Inquilinus limosus]